MTIFQNAFQGDPYRGFFACAGHLSLAAHTWRPVSDGALPKTRPVKAPCCEGYACRDACAWCPHTAGYLAGLVGTSHPSRPDSARCFRGTLFIRDLRLCSAQSSAIAASQASGPRDAAPFRRVGSDF